MPIDEARWASTNAYAREVFGREPDHIRTNREAAEEAGLPGRAITPEVGQLLALLAATTAGRSGLEIGTLSGYSTLWLLEGMRPDARIITLEYVDTHAALAEQEFARCGVGERVEVRRGAAVDLLPDIARALSPGSVDVVFIDADKAEYPDYYEATAGLVAPGGLRRRGNPPTRCTTDRWRVERGLESPALQLASTVTRPTRTPAGRRTSCPFPRWRVR